jgi:hypothetical protein
LKHFSLTIAIARSETLHLTLTTCETFLIYNSHQDEAAIMSRHTEDENPTVKARKRKEKEKDKVKLEEALKSVHFQVSHYIFSFVPGSP